MENFLREILTQRIALLKNIYGGVYEIKEEYALELCELAKEWSMDELNFACQEFLKTGINLNNFREVAQKAEEMK